MREEDAKVGTYVKSNRDFSGVPAGTKGMIVEDYGHGVTVAWDLPDKPLPNLEPKEMTFQAMPAINPDAPLRDGFSKKMELDFLDRVVTEKVTEEAGGVAGSQ